MNKLEIINTTNLDRWDYLSVFIYLIITAVIYLDPLGGIDKSIVLFYSCTTPILLYLINYKSLRKNYVWAIWLLIAFVHLWLYFEISEIPKYQFYRGSAAEFLKFTWIFLILFQMLQVLSLHINKREFVTPNMSGIDFWDKRKIITTDYICASIYVGIYILVGII